MFSDLTVLENLTIGGMIGQRSRDQRMAEVFELFPDLRALQAQKAGTLSGGESRMVACGRALMQDPKILLLDEPTAGLSPLYVDLFFDKIREIHRDKGRRHRPGRAERHQGAPGRRPGHGAEPWPGVRGHGRRPADDPAAQGGLPDLITDRIALRARHRRRRNESRSGIKSGRILIGLAVARAGRQRVQQRRQRHHGARGVGGPAGAASHGRRSAEPRRRGEPVVVCELAYYTGSSPPTGRRSPTTCASRSRRSSTPIRRSAARGSSSPRTSATTMRARRPRSASRSTRPRSW